MRILYIPDRRGKFKLELGFDDILNADSLVTHSGNVARWNLFFNLPTWGGEFASVEVSPGNKAVNYGGLYNRYVYNDPRGITPPGWHLPSRAEFEQLAGVLYSNIGGKLKETGLTHWKTPNLGATNSCGFNGRGAGVRGSDGGFMFNLEIEAFATSTNYNPPQTNFFPLGYNSTDFSSSTSEFTGFSVRFIKDNSVNTGSVTDYDGNVYDTVKIGDQVWMASNLIVEHFNNGEYIPYVTDNTEWANLTTAGMCHYNNDRTMAYAIPCLITLYGGHHITMKDFLFYNNTHLLSVIDYGCILQTCIFTFQNCSGVKSFIFPVLQITGPGSFANCVNATFKMPELVTSDILSFSNNNCPVFDFPNLVAVGQSLFQDCNQTTTFILPKVTSLQKWAFLRCTAATSFYLPSLTEISGVNVWAEISGQTITLTVTHEIMVVNGGNPHNEIQLLLNNNTVTVMEV